MISGRKYPGLAGDSALVLVNSITVKLYWETALRLKKDELGTG